jgi:pseudaminic acid synthase
MKNIQIDHFEISDNSKVFIIAELSANHNQNLNLALETIHAMSEAGADAVKFQTYTADTMTIDSDNDLFYKKNGLWKGYTLYQLYEKASTPWDWHSQLMEKAKSLGLICFSAPFDKTSVDFLEKLEVPAYKIASFEITDIPLIEYTASKGKPVIISTGIATVDDIQSAIIACKDQGNEQVILLKCTSAYPAKIEDANLLSIPEMKKIFKCPVGLSDHTPGINVPIASVALGAKIIEKHFILNKSIQTPDVAFSLDKDEFAKMVQAVRETELALGSGEYIVTESMKNSRKGARSLFVVQDIKANAWLTEENVRSIRPGQGLHPKYLSKIIGKKATRYLKKGTPLAWEHIQ